MKNIIDQVRFRTYGNKPIVQFFLRKKISDLIGKDIIFDVKTLTMRRPTLDSRKFHMGKHNNISFYVEREDIPDMLGLYNVIQKDEDTFIFKKVKNA